MTNMCRDFKEVIFSFTGPSCDTLYVLPQITNPTFYDTKLLLNAIPNLTYMNLNIYGNEMVIHDMMHSFKN